MFHWQPHGVIELPGKQPKVSTGTGAGSGASVGAAVGASVGLY